MGIEAIELFDQMPLELINEVTYISVLNACSHSGLVHQAQRIFQDIQIKTGKIYATMVNQRLSFF
jgi:transcriptional regulatory protein LevR